MSPFCDLLSIFPQSHLLNRDTLGEPKPSLVEEGSLRYLENDVVQRLSGFEVSATLIYQKLPRWRNFGEACWSLATFHWRHFNLPWSLEEDKSVDHLWSGLCRLSLWNCKIHTLQDSGWFFSTSGYASLNWISGEMLCLSGGHVALKREPELWQEKSLGPEPAAGWVTLSKPAWLSWDISAPLWRSLVLSLCETMNPHFNIGMQSDIKNSSYCTHDYLCPVNGIGLSKVRAK